MMGRSGLMPFGDILYMVGPYWEALECNLQNRRGFEEIREKLYIVNWGKDGKTNLQGRWESPKVRLYLFLKLA